MDEYLLFENGAEFRSYLTSNSSGSNGVWLIFSKSKELITITAEAALQEALCFGWIDGQMKSIDEIKYIKKFTPRRKGSNWSEKNKTLALRLIQEGKMTEMGLRAIEEAKSCGAWDAPKPEPISDEQIGILVQALNNIEPALSNFKEMSRSVKATYTAHYLSAKSEATREKRLMQIIERLNENKKPM